LPGRAAPAWPGARRGKRTDQVELPPGYIKLPAALRLRRRTGSKPQTAGSIEQER